MIRREHQKGDAASCAVYSDCESYRYELSRVWEGKGDHVLFVMLNPSTATELRNDPTIERCERRARMLGFGGMSIANLFGFRATDPRDLRAAPEPIGDNNDTELLRLAQQADMVIAAWGVHGAHLERGPQMADWLRSKGIALHHLGLTRDGHPRHPLYLRYDVAPTLWDKVR